MHANLDSLTYKQLSGMMKVQKAIVDETYDRAVKAMDDYTLLIDAAEKALTREGK